MRKPEENNKFRKKENAKKQHGSTILRYVSSNHGKKYTVQPLPPNHFSVEVNIVGVDGIR